MFFLGLAVAGPALAADTPVPKTEAQRFSYSIGVDLGRSLKPVADNIDVESLKQGLDDSFTRNTSRLTDEEREAVKNVVAKRLQESQMKSREASAEISKSEGAVFLRENALKPFVRTTASGLQYKVLKEGTGPRPTASNKVTVNYKGTLISGETFDSSYDRGQPITFPLANVIPGWTEGVQLMNVGAKYQFFIPSQLAYGERGAGVKIGPNATLIFEVELLGIE